MVFSSIPAYLDPANWQQQPGHQTVNHASPHQLHQQQLQQMSQPPPPQLLQPPPQPGSIRPGSMAERARMANIPMPEPSLKCPRCESSNTKFCYFNNYSLTQPRHFCKTCRRYWTRGGALRNVPVGGGCRRNKRTKSGASSKSPASSGDRDRQTASSSTSNNTASSNGTIGMNASHHMPSLLGLTPPQIPPLRFLSPMSQLSEHFGGSEDIGLNYGGGGGGGLSAPPAVGTSEMNMNFHVSPNMLGNGMASLLSSGGASEPWRLQQHFPFLGGLDSPLGLYQVQNNNMEGFIGEQFRPPPKFSGGSMAAPPVKMENSQEMSLSRQLMGMNPAGNANGMNGNQHDHQWNMNMNNASGAANWTDLASFSSSSTTAPL